MKHIIVKSSDLGDNWTAEHHIAKAEEAAAVNLTLTHHSPEPLVFDPERTYDQAEMRGWGKPRGLWLSDDSDHGWKAWCEAEEWNLGGLDHSAQFRLTPDANVLHIRTPAELKAFSDEYSVEAYPGSGTLNMVPNWHRVAAEFDGILITPYQWESRYDFDVFWYAGWDCASGCFWNLRAIEPVTS
jgi:hypothetical protein